MGGEGWPWARIDSSLVVDPKVRRLLRKHLEVDALASLGAWLMVVTETWRIGSREIEDLGIDPVILSRLQGEGLLDGKGRVPQKAWEKWSAEAREGREALERLTQYASKGGQARMRGAARDGSGRVLPAIQPSGESPGGVIPVLGEAAGVLSETQPSPSPAGPAGPALLVQPSSPVQPRVESREKREIRRGVRGESVRGEVTTLSRKQHEAWVAFDEESRRLGSFDAWGPFRDAWIAHGLKYPPSNGQRELLWEMVDARPSETAKAIRRAPRLTASGMIDWLIVDWQKAREAIPEEPPRAATRGLTPLGEIVRKLGEQRP